MRPRAAKRGANVLINSTPEQKEDIEQKGDKSNLENWTYPLLLSDGLGLTAA
jgi:hypothetical protein